MAVASVVPSAALAARVELLAVGAGVSNGGSRSGAISTSAVSRMSTRQQQLELHKEVLSRQWGEENEPCSG